MQDLEQAKIGIKIEKSLKERFDFLNNIENQVPLEIVYEMNSWTDQITKNQPEIFANNMKNKTLSGKNYICKILSDYLTDCELFKKTYQPHLLRPFINYLLQKNIKLTDHYEFIDINENERLFLIKILSLAKIVLKKKIHGKLCMTNYKKNVSLYSLNNYLERDGFKTDNIDIYLKILKNPLSNPNCSLSPFDGEQEIKFVDHLVPDAEINDIFLEGLNKIYFLIK